MSKKRQKKRLMSERNSIIVPDVIIKYQKTFDFVRSVPWNLQFPVHPVKKRYIRIGHFVHIVERKISSQK